MRARYLSFVPDSISIPFCPALCSGKMISAYLLAQTALLSGFQLHLANGRHRKRANCEKTECRISSSCFFLLGQGLTTQLLYLSPQLLTGSPFPTATTPSKFSTHTFITCPFTKLSSVTLPSASFFPAVYRLIEHTQGTEHGQVCPLE